MHTNGKWWILTSRSSSGSSFSVRQTDGRCQAVPPPGSLATIIERAELGRGRIESFVLIEEHPVFPLQELPTVLQVHVLSQLPSYAMAVAAQICKTCRDAIPEAARTRTEALGARRLPRMSKLGGSETTSRDWLMRGDTAPPPEEQADWKSHTVAEVRAGAMRLAELSTFAWRTRHRGAFARHVYSMCDEELPCVGTRASTDRGRHCLAVRLPSVYMR